MIQPCGDGVVEGGSPLRRNPQDGSFDVRCTAREWFPSWQFHRDFVAEVHYKHFVPRIA